jgi:hypothetical protein
VSEAIDSAGKNTVLQMADSIAKYAVAISLVATLISFVSSILMFLQWGLNYAIVATPSDIIVGGIEAFTSAIPILFFAGVSFVIIDLFSLHKIERIYVSALMMLLLACLGTLTVFGFYFPDCLISAVKGKANLFESLYVLVVFLVTLLGLTFIVMERGNKLFWTSLSIPIFMYLQLLGYTSVNRDKDVIIAGTSKNCKSIEHVVWAGSEALVTSCAGPPYDHTRSYFILERTGQTIEVRSNSANQDKKQ